MRRGRILKSIGAETELALSSGVAIASGYDDWLRIEEELEYKDTFEKRG